VEVAGDRVEGGGGGLHEVADDVEAAGTEEVFRHRDRDRGRSLVVQGCVRLEGPVHVDRDFAAGPVAGAVAAPVEPVEPDADVL
jgi:hypothetical protein